MKNRRSPRGNGLVRAEFDAIGAELTIKNYGIERTEGKERFDWWMRDVMKCDISLLTMEMGQFNTMADEHKGKWITQEQHERRGVALRRYIAKLFDIEPEND
jgi:hypothetical protein